MAAAHTEILGNTQHSSQHSKKSRVVLAARGLRRDFGSFTAVDNVDLDVEDAKIHALIGPNGAGKTTVFNLLTKFLPPTSGTITLLDQDITKMAPARVARIRCKDFYKTKATNVFAGGSSQVILQS